MFNINYFAMKRSKFTEAQIVFALRQAETGVKVVVLHPMCLKNNEL